MAHGGSENVKDPGLKKGIAVGHGKASKIGPAPTLLTNSLLITVPGRPFSLNAERTQHWTKQASRTKELRVAAYYATLELLGSKPPQALYQQVTIQVFPCALNRRYRQDVGNIYPSVKACIDGFVDANVIPDDNDNHLKWLTFHPHQFGKDQIVFKITEVIDG